MQKIGVPGVLEVELDKDEDNPEKAVCSVAGVVYNRDTGGPFTGVEVGEVPPGSAFTDEESFQYRATSGPDGSYSFDCSPSGEPGALALKLGGWGSCIDVTRQTIAKDKAQRNVTIYVSDKVMRTLGGVFGLPRNDNCTR